MLHRDDVNGPPQREEQPQQSEYAAGVLLRLRDKNEYREFRTVTGGVLHVKGGATRDLLPFDGSKVTGRTFIVVLQSLGPGKYGFLLRRIHFDNRPLIVILQGQSLWSLTLRPVRPFPDVTQLSAQFVLLSARPSTHQNTS